MEAGLSILGKTVFLDRDGVINACAKEHDYIKTWGEFRFLNGTIAAIRMLNEAGYQVIVVTNQRGVAQGLMTEQDVDYIHECMCRELAKQGGHIDAIYVCPHEKGKCTCRKPQTGLFLQAERRFRIDKSFSWMIGDSESDMEAGKRYGVKTIFLGEGNPVECSCNSLKDAARIILESELSK
jgi:histidinol-phosphate phosphatase family domain/HAD-superfamily hydrolase, subfamily IIIA